MKIKIKINIFIIYILILLQILYIPLYMKISDPNTPNYRGYWSITASSWLGNPTLFAGMVRIVNNTIIMGDNNYNNTSTATFAAAFPELMTLPPTIREKVEFFLYLSEDNPRTNQVLYEDIYFTSNFSKWIPWSDSEFFIINKEPTTLMLPQGVNEANLELGTYGTNITKKVILSDDNQTYYWNLDSSIMEYSFEDDDETKISGNNSLRIFLNSTLEIPSDYEINHVFSEMVNWSDKNFFHLWFKGIGSKERIDIIVYSQNSENFFMANFYDLLPGWRELFIPFNSFSPVGTPDWESVTRIRIGPILTSPDVSGVFYIDEVFVANGSTSFRSDEYNIIKVEIQASNNIEWRLLLETFHNDTSVHNYVDYPDVSGIFYHRNQGLFTFYIPFNLQYRNPIFEVRKIDQETDAFLIFESFRITRLIKAPKVLITINDNVILNGSLEFPEEKWFTLFPNGDNYTRFTEYGSWENIVKIRVDANFIKTFNEVKITVDPNTIWPISFKLLRLSINTSELEKQIIYEYIPQTRIFLLVVIEILLLAVVLKKIIIK